VVSARIPTLLQDTITMVVVFSIFLLISLAEMPMMLFGLRKMAQATGTPRIFVAGTFAVFVTFAAVYATVFALLTSGSAGGHLLAALCVARFVSGVWIKSPSPSS